MNYAATISMHGGFLHHQVQSSTYYSNYFDKK